MFLIKFDNLDNQLWNKTWPSIGSEPDYGFDITIDPATGDIYCVGSTQTLTAGQFDLVLVKFDSSGNYIWNRTWGGANRDDGYGIAIDDYGDIYIAGTTESKGAGGQDFALIKYNNTGHQLWNRTWGGTLDDACYGLNIDSNNNLYLIGDTKSYGEGSNDLCIVKYNLTGAFNWSKTWGDKYENIGRDIAFDALDNIYVTGHTYNCESYKYDVMFAKYNPLGILQYHKCWGGSGTDFGYGITLNQTSNDIYIAGSTKSFGAGDYDIYLVKNPLQTCTTCESDDDDDDDSEKGELVILGYPSLFILLICTITTIYLIKSKQRKK